MKTNKASHRTWLRCQSGEEDLGSSLAILSQTKCGSVKKTCGSVFAGAPDPCGGKQEWIAPSDRWNFGLTQPSDDVRRSVGEHYGR